MKNFDLKYWIDNQDVNVITRDGQKVVGLRRQLLHGTWLLYGILERDNCCEMWSEDGLANPTKKEDAHDLFFDLTESDDEKTKEKIIRMIKLSCTNDDDVDKCLAYLEKQEKDKLILEDKIESLHAALEAKELTWKKRIEEQKPAWSKEDKDKLNRIFSIVGQAADTHAFSTTCRLIGDKECIELQDFLKSLKDRIQLRRDPKKFEEPPKLSSF